MERKAMVFHGRSLQLLRRYERTRLFVPLNYGSFVGQSPCFNQLASNSSRNITLSIEESQVTEQLHLDFEKLKTVVGMLMLMKNEEMEFEQGQLSHKLQKLKMSAEFLMCELNIAMETLGRQSVERIIQPIIRTWCLADGRVSRYRRDAILVFQMLEFGASLKTRYTFYKNNMRRNR